MTASDRVRQGVREDIIRSRFHDADMRNLGDEDNLDLKVVRRHAERLVKAVENAKAAERKVGGEPDAVDAELLVDAESARSILLRLNRESA